MDRKIVQLARKFSDAFHTQSRLERAWWHIGAGAILLSQAASFVHSFEYDDAPDENADAAAFSQFEGEIRKLSALPADLVPEQSMTLATAIIKDKRLSEWNIQKLTYTVADVTGMKSVSALAPGSFAFTKDCNATLPATADITQIHSCMVEKNAPYRTAHGAILTSLAGSIPLLGLFGIAAAGMRRRVGEAEKKIKTQDFSQSVEALRQTVLPRKER